MHSSANLSASLHWVQGELAQSLQRVRSLIEKRIESPEDPQPLKQAIVELNQVRGTASMIQCAGIAGLAEEMKRAVQDLLSGSATEAEGVYAALMGAAVELADYVDALVTGMQDSVLVFQPAISELRVSRGKPAANDAEVFADQSALAAVKVELPQESSRLPTDAAQLAAKKFLNVFQQNLVLWIRNQDIQLALGRIGKVSEQIAAASQQLPLYQLWRMTAALAEALLTRGLDDVPELRRLMGRAGAQLKLLAEQGDAAAVAALGNLPYQFLFHVGRSRSQGPRVAALKNAYNLERLIPAPDVVESLRAKIRGPNSALLLRLSEEIRKDLSQVKDQIDLAVRGGGKSAVDFSPTIEKLNRVGVTLSMLGLTALQDVVQSQARSLSGLSLDAGSAAHPAWLELATALLRVEHSLDDALSRQLRRARSESGGDAAPESLSGGIPNIDVQEGREALMRESLVDLSKLKVAADDYLQRGFQEQKDEAVRLLAQIEPGLQILGSELAAAHVVQLRRFMQSQNFDRVRSERALAEKFADVIAGIEYYFEGLRSQSPDTDNRVDRLASYLAQLQAQFAPVPTAEEQPDAVTALPEPEAAPEPPAALEPAREAPVAPQPGPVVAMAANAADEVDPEIRGIFVEEATEVLESLRTQVEALRRNAKDVEALREARRGFHTLKGSGRMVGAAAIGEFSYAIEKLLNKCLEDGAAFSTPVLELTAEAVDRVPLLVDHFKNRRTDDAGAGELAARAQQLASGEEADVDADLLATFAKDAHARLATVMGWVQKQDLAQSQFVLSRDVTAAFHTLRGSAALVQADGVARLSGELEDYLLKIGTRHAPLPSGGLQLLADASTELQRCVGQLAAGQRAEPDLTGWHKRVAEAEAALPASADAAGAGMVPKSHLFALDAFGKLEAIEQALLAWESQPGDMARAAIVRSGLEQLAQVAARPCAPQSQVATELAESVVPMATQNPAYFAAIKAVLEGMYTQLDQLREDSLDFSDMALREQACEVAALAAAPAPAEAQQPEPEPPAMSEFGDVAAEEILDVPPVATEEVLDVPPVADEEVLDVPPVAEQGADDVPDVPVDSNVDSDAMEVPHAGDGSHAAELQHGEELDMPPVADEAPVMEPEAAIDIPPVELAAVPASVPGPVAAPVDSLADPELIAIFQAEAEELLESMNQHILTLERDAANRDALPGLARDLHTFKGGARMSGLMAMGTAAHEMESRVEKLSDGRIQPGVSAVSQLRSQWEGLQILHDRLSHGSVVPAAPVPEPIENFEDAAPRADAEVADVEVARDDGAHEELAEAPAEPILPAAAKAAVPASTVPKVNREALIAAGWDPQLFWVPEDSYDEQATRRELARVPVERLDRMLNEAGEISIYRSRIEQQYTGLTFQLEEMQQTLSRIKDQLRALDIETDAQIAARGFAQAVDDERSAYSEFDPLEMDRYTRMQELSRALSESLNDLSSLRTSMDEQLSETETLLLQQGRVNTEVQRGLMGTLMVPFARQESRLQRVVRQTAQDTDKRAELHFDGLEQELDRNVLERMVAPLEHLLRNSVVHGLESPQKRLATGKPETGRIQVSLRREGTQLAIEVRDDGQGLNYEAIRRTAIERGLMPAQAKLRDAEVAMFIFEAGFSTAKELTQSAGRGVGMDVVASEVKQLGGTLELSSEPGKGARFMIRLPLTLAMSQVLLVGVGQEVYAIPLTTLEGIARLPREQMGEYLREGGPRYHYGGLEYGVRPLGDLLGTPPHDVPTDTKTVPAVLIRLGEGLTAADRRVAVVVDALLGNREIVSKAVGPQVSAVQGISGGTVLPDGRVVLILDVPALLTNRARRVAVVEAAHEPAAIPAAADARRTIMVVDDSITIRRVTERLLGKHGFRVVTAKDGLDAMTQLQTESPAAILLDIEMPRADGFEVAAFVRNNPRIQQVPIIMITSRSGEKHRERARQIGVNRYVIKPYQEEQMMVELRGVLGSDET